MVGRGRSSGRSTIYPHLDRQIGIHRPRRDHILLRVGRDGHDNVSMTIEDLHDFPALQVPQVYLAVFATRHDPLAAGDAEAGGDAVLGILVADVGLQAARGLKVPQPYRAVVCGGENVFRVGRKLHVLADGIVALGEGLEALSRW